MLVISIVVGLIINAIIAGLIGKLGREKKIGYRTSFWVSFLLSPIIGILMVIASVPLSDQDKADLKPSNIDWEKIGENISADKYVLYIVIMMAIIIFAFYRTTN
jgi:MFS family permease